MPGDPTINGSSGVAGLPPDVGVEVGGDVSSRIGTTGTDSGASGNSVPGISGFIGLVKYYADANFHALFRYGRDDAAGKITPGSSEGTSVDVEAKNYALQWGRTKISGTYSDEIALGLASDTILGVCTQDYGGSREVGDSGENFSLGEDSQTALILGSQVAVGPAFRIADTARLAIEVFFRVETAVTFGDTEEDNQFPGSPQILSYGGQATILWGGAGTDPTKDRVPTKYDVTGSWMTAAVDMARLFLMNKTNENTDQGYDKTEAFSGESGGGGAAARESSDLPAWYAMMGAFNGYKQGLWVETMNSFIAKGHGEFVGSGWLLTALYGIGGAAAAFTGASREHGGDALVSTGMADAAGALSVVLTNAFDMKPIPQLFTELAISALLMNVDNKGVRDGAVAVGIGLVTNPDRGSKITKDRESRVIVTYNTHSDSEASAAVAFRQDIAPSPDARDWGMYTKLTVDGLGNSANRISEGAVGDSNDYKNPTRLKAGAGVYKEFGRFEVAANPHGFVDTNPGGAAGAGLEVSASVEIGGGFRIGVQGFADVGRRPGPDGQNETVKDIGGGGGISQSF